MDKVELLLLAVYLAYVIAPMIRDELSLRVMLLVTSVGFVVWGYAVEERVTVGANILFVFLSIRHIARIIKQRQPVVLSAEQESIRVELFDSMTPRQFEKFWDLGVPSVAHGGQLLRKGELVDEIVVVMEGAAQVELDTGDRSAVAPVLLGEMSYALGEEVPASATVRLDEPVPIRTWTKAVLRDLKRNDPELEVPFLASLGQNLARKIRL